MAPRRACSGLNGKEPPQRRSERFLEGLRDAPSVTFVTHGHADPDGLGSMMGLAHLVETRLGKPTRLTRDGVISRAENRAMVELLDLDLAPIDKIEWDPSDAVVMVDSQPKTGRHNLAPGVPLYAVIDHHDTPGDTSCVPFIDVRNVVGATCSLVTSYLIEQEVPLPARLATGLLYGIETELGGYPREASETFGRARDGARVRGREWGVCLAVYPSEAPSGLILGASPDEGVGRLPLALLDDAQRPVEVVKIRTGAGGRRFPPTPLVT